MGKMKRTLLAVLVLALVQCTDPTPPPRAKGDSATVKHPTSVALNVVVWDSTELTTAPLGTEVWIRGHGSWFPDLEQGIDSKTFGPFKVGNTTTIYFYPQGREEPEIKIASPITADFCPQGCPRWSVYLDIQDDRFEYTTPHGDSESFPRPVPKLGPFEIDH